MKVIAYLKNQLGVGNHASTDFLKQWRPLSDTDKDELKQYARTECAALGIALED